MPRPIEYDREEILQKATELFWINGYEKTSIRDVLETTKFNRHSLYEEFGGKDGLYKEVLDYYKNNIACELIDALNDKNSDLDTIKNIFNIRVESEQKELGCLFANTAHSKSVLDDELYQLAKRHNLKVEKAFELCIKHAQEKGQIPKGKNPRVLSRYLSTVFHGLATMNKMGITKKDSKIIGEMAVKTIVAE